MNKYGKGQAIYLAAPAQPSLIGPILSSLYGPLGIQLGPATPEGVYARVVEGRTLYVNTTEEEKNVAVGMNAYGVLTHKLYEGKMILGPYQADLVK